MRTLDAVAAHPRLLGVRHVVQGEPDGFLASPAFRRGVARPRSLRSDLRHPGVRAAAARSRGTSCARFREQRFVLDHLGKPDIRAAGSTAGGRHFAALGRIARTSGANYRAWSPKPTGTRGRRRSCGPTSRPRSTCSAPSRLMIGSDWPVCTLAAPVCARRCGWWRTRSAAVTPDERAQHSRRDRSVRIVECSECVGTLMRATGVT